MKALLLILATVLSIHGATLTLTNVNVGTSANDNTGDTLRTAFIKINTNTTTISNELLRLQEIVINVKDSTYGALGNGTSNDKTAIQAAATAAANKVLFFPNGTYYVEGTITLPSSIQIYGPGAIIKQGSSNTVLFTGANLTNVTFEDITLQGHGGDYSDTADRNARAVDFTGTANSNIRFRNVRFYYFMYAGIHAVGTTDLYIDNCLFQGPGTPTITAGGSYCFGIDLKNTCRNVTIRNNRFYDLASGYYSGENIANLVMEGNIFRNMQQHGAYFSDGENVLFANNVVTNIPLSGVKFQVQPTSTQGGRGHIVSGNAFHNVAGAAIIFHRAGAVTDYHFDGCLIVNNSIQGSTPDITTGAGIQAEYMRNSFVGFNTISNKAEGLIFQWSMNTDAVYNRMYKLQKRGMFLNELTNATIAHNIMEDVCLNTNSTAPYGIQVHTNSVGTSGVLRLAYNRIVSTGADDMDSGIYLHTPVTGEGIKLIGNISDKRLYTPSATTFDEYENNTFSSLLSFPTSATIKGQKARVSFGGTPTTGTSITADITYFQSITNTIGAISTSGGSPGTWKEFGLINDSTFFAWDTPNKTFAIGTTPSALNAVPLTVRRDTNAIIQVRVENRPALGNTSSAAAVTVASQDSSGFIGAYPSDHSGGSDLADMFNVSANSDASALRLSAAGSGQVINIYAGSGTKWGYFADGVFKMATGATPTTDAFGEIAGDNDAWASGRGALQVYDGTANTYLVGVLTTDAPSNGQVPKWNTGGTITWEDDTGGAGSGDNITVDAGAVTDPDFTDSTDINFTANTVPTPDTIAATFVRTGTLAGNLGLAASDAVFSDLGLIFEGLTADTLEGELISADITAADKTWTLPDASGTIIVSGHTFTGDVTATVGAAGTTALTGASGLTRDTEWDTVAEIETATGANLIVNTEIDTVAEIEALAGSVNLITATEIDTEAELQTILGGLNLIVSTEIDTVAEIETLAGSVNLLTETEIDASSELLALMDDETGTGVLVFGTSPTITTPTISGAISFPDNTRQTFNPGADAAGINVGSHAGDPGTPSNGDLWYDSTANELTARINGANVALGGGGTLPTTSLGDWILHDGSSNIRAYTGKVFRYTDEFIYGLTSSFVPWDSGGTGAVNIGSAESGRIGIVRLDCSTSATGTRRLNHGISSVRLGGGIYFFETSVYIVDLSDVTEEYDFRIGLGDTTTARHTDGVYFEYDRNNSANWIGVCSKAGAHSTVDTTSAVAAATWVRLGFLVNAGATSVQFYVNGSAAGAAVTTNIPDTDSNLCGLYIHIAASAGSTANVREVRIDYVDAISIFTSAR